MRLDKIYKRRQNGESGKTIADFRIDYYSPVVSTRDVYGDVIAEPNASKIVLSDEFNTDNLELVLTCSDIPMLRDILNKLENGKRLLAPIEEEQ